MKTQYRIKVVTKTNGEVEYYPQYKSFLFWRYFISSTWDGNPFNSYRLYFNNSGEALKEIYTIIYYESDEGKKKLKEAKPPTIKSVEYINIK